MKSPAAAVLITVAVIGACAANVAAVGPDEPDSPAVQRADLHAVATDGDWVLARPTTTAPLHRAGLYDATHDVIVEASDGAIRETAIADGAAIIVVRPANMTATDRRTALARARSRLGLASSDDAAAFVTWASQTAARSGAGPAVTPADLMTYGEVVFMGLAKQVQATR